MNGLLTNVPLEALVDWLLAGEPVLLLWLLCEFLSALSWSTGAGAVGDDVGDVAADEGRELDDDDDDEEADDDDGEMMMVDSSLAAST